MMDVERVVIRVDSSEVIGSGHLMRCLTLAERMRSDGKQVHFICRNLVGNLSQLITAKGFILHMLPAHRSDISLAGYAAWLTVPKETDAEETIEIVQTIQPVDRLVVDSYALDIDWEQKIRPFVREVFVIDDLANRRHDCDLLLDQNFYQKMEQRYEGLVPSSCKLLLGPQHILLREEFYVAREHLRERDGCLRRILVFYGGSDATQETEKAIRALVHLRLQSVAVDVVVGGGNARREQIASLCGLHDFLHYYFQVDHMAELMANADLCLGAGGTATWERCFLGLPAIVTAVADNQIEICEACSESRLIYYLGRWDEVTEEDIVEAVRRHAAKSFLRKMQKSCQFWNLS